MSGSTHFWLAFAAGLAVSVAGIALGIRAEARNQHRAAVTCFIALGGVMMIAAAALLRDPDMPWFQATALMNLMLGLSFFAIWRVLLHLPSPSIRSEESAVDDHK